MTDYSKMSDFEINCKVANALGMTKHFFFLDAEDEFDDDIEPSERGPIWQTREHFVNGYRPSNGNPFNPCNNPSDAWPIIFEDRIAIIPDSAAGEWVAFNEFTLYEGDWMFASDPARHVNGNNPLRAAMIVYLMMKESENADI